MNPANDYVRDFVAHTNPLNVLLAKDLMRPLDTTEETTQGHRLSKRHDYWLSTDKKATIYRDTRCELQRWQAGQDIASLKNAGTIVTANTPMRDVLEIRYDTDHSVFIEENNKIVGFIGDKELYHSLLGKMLIND